MVQYFKNTKRKNRKGGFTLVELMVVLAITAILASLVGGGLIAYTRLARFEKNEANARTLFQTAQISLTRMETAGELDAFRQQVAKDGSLGNHFKEDVLVTDDSGNTLVDRKREELNQNVAALYYDRTGPADGNHNALVEQLLGDYIYDESLLNASICVEIDIQSGQVYSVFYDTKSDKLRFQEAGATDIYDRSYSHRRNDSLVGYYSAEDRVNVVQLVQTKLKVKNPRLTNGETLTLSWSGNSNLGDLDTSYTATAYAKEDAAKQKPLFAITIQRDAGGTAGDDKQVITKMPVTIYHYTDTGTQTSETKELYFPLSYNKGSFVLTLDAMADAALLRASENSADVAASSLYSITRMLTDPEDIYIAMRAEPRESYSDTYTASKEESTNVENTLLAKGGTADEADLKYFRHLYNLRWSADWKITNNTGKGTYTLTRQANNSTGLNWTGGGVTVYCAAGAWPPVAKVPSLNDPVAWPTIPELGENIVLTSETTGMSASKATRVPILNLQLSSKSVAEVGRAEKTELTDHYVGLIGENKGEISYITLRDPDIQVNVKTETVDAGTLPGENQLKLTATKFVTVLEETDDDWRDVRAVGALCGVNTGTLKNCALTRGTNSSTSALVAAALAFDSTTTATERDEQTLPVNNKNYTYYKDEPRGIGGLVGVAMPESGSEMRDLTVASDVTVAGLLVDKDTKTVEKTTAADQKAEKARYAAAAAGPEDKGSLWRSVGVGGVFGTVDAARMTTDRNTNIVNNGFVTGNGFTGGIIGNLFTTGTDTGTSPVLTGLTNNGTVSAGANYKGDTAGDARSLVLGQFFGGIAGYGRDVTLLNCKSVTRSDLTETQLKEQVKAGFNTKTGALTDASPLKGDFVGGLIGYGKDITLDGCSTGKGYVLGSRFVGGLAGGFTGSSLHENGTNSSDVFGNRYVGGIVSVNGNDSRIVGMANTGLAAAFGHNAAYVGGIVGVNDATWGYAGAAVDKEATVLNCANRMSGDNATDTRRINLLKELSGYAGKTEYANYVGGITGCNGENGVVTWNESGTPSLGAILYGNNYVGGVAGYNDEKATISNTSRQNLTIRGQVVAAGKAVGGMIGLNCAPTLPAVTVAASRVAGQQLVGGVIGANLPVGSFTVAVGAFKTDVASGRVEADAVAGGIIGYNRLLASKSANTALADLLPSVDTETGVLTDSTKVRTGSAEITLTDFQNKLNLQADIYVGGIVGANDADTKLTIQKAVNGASQNALSVGGLNPSNGTFKDGVSLRALAGDRYNFDTARGALAGGIIGYATTGTTLQDCTNYGTVAHKCAAGGFAGWNEGTITGGNMEASLGNRETGYTYLGGVAGVNGGLIQYACPAQGRAVRGDSYIGGIAGVNLGGDVTANTRQGLIGCTGNTPAASVEANQYAGGVAGVNVGSISLSGSALQSSVTATSYAGGVAGINTTYNTYAGRIYGDTNTKGAVWGSVSAANYAGGVAGTNSASITWMENRASVRASAQYAGGIAGVNDKGGTISRCSHASSYTDAVYATNGEAGGIAGNNNAGASIDNVQVSAAVTAANGTAGGVTATNFGTIGQEAGLENDSSVSGCTITGTSESIGAVAAYNRAGATIRNVKLAENATVQFSTPAVTIGGLAGMNEGTVTGCRVENGALKLDAGLRAGTNTITLGGAVGRTTKDSTVSSTDVLLNLTQNLDKYTNLGGVAGQNDGTLDQCTYSGTMGGSAGTNGSINGGAASAGSTMGGIAGVNHNLIENCIVTHISLQAQGAFNVADTQTADQKMQNASHVGGIAGSNAGDGLIRSSYIATDSGSLVAARYGFVGGVAGSNSGKITDSGSQAAFASGKNTQPLMTKIKYWLAQDDGNGNALTSSVKYARLNAMLDILKYGKNKDASESEADQNKYTYDYAALHGQDTVPDTLNQNYSAYSGTALGSNALTVALRGCTSDNDRASGYLGGITGFNTTTGSIVSTATGNWFVYGDNVSTGSTVGGAVGQNETAAEMTYVVNCAAVRRFTRVKNTADYSNDNIYPSDYRVDTQIGGLICTQQNRTGDTWKITGSVNLGTVFNSRSFNAGGIISLWENYGGTLEYCYNLGTLQTNTNDVAAGKGAAGAVGGIAGYLREPVSGSATNIISCSNYGDILWTKAKDNTVYGANDVGGILGKIEMASGNDYMTLNIIDCVNGPVTLQAKSMVSGIMGWMGQYDDAPKYVQVNIDRCRNLSYNLQVNGWSSNGNDVFIAGIVGNRGGKGGKANDIKATTSVTNCFAIYNVSTSVDNTQSGAYKIPANSYSPIVFLRTEEDKVSCSNNYYIDRSSLGEGDKNGSSFSRAFETMRHTANAQATAPYGSEISNVPWQWRRNAITGNQYGKSLFLGIDQDETGANKFFAAAMQADSNAKTDYQQVDGRKDYIKTSTTPKTIVRGSGTNTTVQASLLLWFSDITKQDYTSGADGYPGFADITDKAIQEYYLNVLDSEKPQAPTNVQVKESRTTADDNKVYGRYEVTWDEPENNAHPASYYTVEVLPSDDKGNITSKEPLLTADVFERRYTFENRTDMEKVSPYFVVRITPHNGCTTGADNTALSNPTQFLTALPTPEIEVRLVRTPGVNGNAGRNGPFAYEQVLVLTNYDAYKEYDGWKVSVTASRINPQNNSEQTDTFTFSASDNGPKYIRKAMDDGGLKGVTTRITAYAETTGTDSKWMRSAQYEETAFIPATWMGNNSIWSDQNGLANEKLTTSDITFTGNSVDNLTVKATLNFKPSYTAQGNPTYRVMLRAKYTGDETVTLNGQTIPLKGQYITLAAQERTVANTDTTFTLSGLPKDTLTNYEDWTAIAVPINSGVGDVVTRWKITEQEAAKFLNTYGENAWWMNGLEIVRKADGTGYEYATLTPLCMVDTNHTEYLGWANAVKDKVKLVRMTKTILKAPILAEDTDGGKVNPDSNELTYTFSWTQTDMKATDAAPTYQIKLYGLLTDENGNVTGQEEIALKDGVTLTPKRSGTSWDYTLALNVDQDLANGSDSWRYDKVRLEVTRVAAAGTDEIGASAVADYTVKQRLPSISAPSSITRVNGETDNADALLYTVSWSQSGDERIDHYDLCAVDADGKTVLTLPTQGNTGSLTLDLEQYQGVTMSFRVIARRKKGDDNCFDGPNGALSQSETIVKRADAPKVDSSSFASDSPNQETFLNDLKLNMTLTEAAKGNVYFTGYIFSDPAKYNDIADLAKAWQELPAGQDKYKAQQALTQALNEMLDSGDAELVIPKDNRTVGESAGTDGTTASYTFVPDGNGFTLTPDHAKQYLLPAVRVMPTDGTTASNWFYILRDADAAQLPAITLDDPVDKDESDRALGNAVYTQEVNLYNDPECTADRGTDTLDLRRFTVEWTAVNKYTQADGTVRNLTDSYTFTVTPLGEDKTPYDITVVTYDKETTDPDGTVHPRGEIKTVTKTINGVKTELEKQTTVVDAETGKTRTWYDLSVEPDYDENDTLTGWSTRPYEVKGTMDKDGGTLYYKAQTVPMLELVQEDGAEPVYRITLPELQEKVQDDTLDLQKFTASVELQTLAHSDHNDKTVESGKVKVTVNETNTADVTAETQSMDPAESAEPAETAESTAAAESAPDEGAPVLMLARAALPVATPETADAPDETDAAETAPPEQTETTDAS